MIGKNSNKKYVWILIGCIALIALVFTIHTAETKLMYGENLQTFYNFTLEASKTRIREIVTRTAHDMDMEREQISIEIESIFQNVNSILDGLIDKHHIDQLISILKMSDSCKVNDLHQRMVIWSNSEQQIKDSTDPQFPTGTKMAKEELLQIIQSYQYHVVRGIEDDQYMFAVYLTDEQLEREMKDRIANGIRQTKLERDGYIWVTEILDYNGGEAYSKSIVQPNLPESEGRIIAARNMEYHGRYPYADELEAIKKDGEGFFIYPFKIHESDEARTKLSYVQHYPDYDWVIGTGIYIDEIYDIVLEKGYEFDNDIQIRNVITAGTMFILFIIAGVTGLVLIKYHEDREKQLIKEKKQLLKEHYRILENKYDKTNQILHDVKNHLICIFRLAEHRNYEQVLHYIQSMQKDIDKLGYIVISGNKVVDIILNHKMEKMKRERILFHHEMEEVQLDFIRSKDIVTIVSNLLDNAIESCMQSEDKHIVLKMYSFNNHFVVFKVTNGCDHKPLLKGGQLLSRKRSNQCYGYGMNNIHRTVHKYGGSMTWKYDDSERKFHVVVMLPKPFDK